MIDIKATYYADRKGTDVEFKANADGESYFNEALSIIEAIVEGTCGIHDKQFIVDFVGGILGILNKNIGEISGEELAS